MEQIRDLITKNDKDIEMLNTKLNNEHSVLKKNDILNKKMNYQKKNLNWLIFILNLII